MRAETGKHAGQQRHGDGEDQDAHIQRGFAEARNVAGIEERQQAQKGERQAGADRSCSNADEERLGD